MSKIDLVQHFRADAGINPFLHLHLPLITLQHLPNLLQRPLRRVRTAHHLANRAEMLFQTIRQQLADGIRTGAFGKRLARYTRSRSASLRAK